MSTASPAHPNNAGALSSHPRETKETEDREAVKRRLLVRHQSEAFERVFIEPPRLA